MGYDIRVERFASRSLAVVRRRASRSELSKVVPEACGIVWNVIRKLQLAGAGRHVAIYLDGQINMEVGVEMDAPFVGYGEVVPSATPSGLVVTTTHLGPYNLLYEAHEAIQHRCRLKGHALIGPSWEIYGHWQPDWNSDPSKIHTEIFYLLTEVEIRNGSDMPR